jgi:transcriptional/translational regulatory protein YebC/TACO1
VRLAIESAKIAVKSYSLAMVAENVVTVSGRDAEMAMKIADTLDDNDDTQNVWSNFDISEEDAARLAEA